MRKLYVIPVLWAVLFAASCMFDKPNPQELLPGGRWVVADAVRDGRPTGTLTDLFYEFLPNDSLFTNISGTPEGMRYYVEDNVIQQRKGPFDADFAIQSITKEEMVVTTVLNSSEFRIRFVRQGQ